MNPAPTGRDGRHHTWPRVLGVGPAGGLEASRANTLDIPGTGTALAHYSDGPR